MLYWGQNSLSCVFFSRSRADSFWIEDNLTVQGSLPIRIRAERNIKLNLFFVMHFLDLSLLCLFVFACLSLTLNRKPARVHTWLFAFKKKVCIWFSPISSLMSKRLVCYPCYLWKCIHVTLLVEGQVRDNLFVDGYMMAKVPPLAKQSFEMQF